MRLSTRLALLLGLTVCLVVWAKPVVDWVVNLIWGP